MGENGNMLSIRTSYKCHSPQGIPRKFRGDLPLFFRSYDPSLTEQETVFSPSKVKGQPLAQSVPTENVARGAPSP